MPVLLISGVLMRMYTLCACIHCTVDMFIQATYTVCIRNVISASDSHDCT